MNKKQILVITGATASGKTKLSIQLAKKLNSEIICADSRIVYKNLDIVSAKPTIEEREGIKHHLIDIKSPNEDFSAGDFVEYSQNIIEGIDSKNIIICGGTWFYIKSLLDDVSLPKCAINKELREELEKLDSTILYEKLKNLDPKRAELIHPNNKDKVIRSIEMCIELGEPISTYQREENKKYSAKWFMPIWDREILYKRINSRVDEMVKLGLIEEYKQNSIKYPNSKIISNTIGYQEFIEFNDENLAIEKIKQHTRNFAKRQLTYFRSNKEIKLINNLEDILKEI